MIPVKTRETVVEGSLPAVASKKFSVSKASEAFLMRSMADLYSNRELACIREYSTNAFDANKELAILEGREPEPIQVTLPDVYDPYFVVKDNGIGMSLEELLEVYTTFGDSTKRQSNDFNGMLGFGSKSAIAYTNIFTIISVKNGMKAVGAVTREEDSMAGYNITLDIVSYEPTDEHSGVTIQIPVHNREEFCKKANDFYRFWHKGTVLINGKEPKVAIGEKIGDDLYYYNTENIYGEKPSYVVMGNVPYRITNARALWPSGSHEVPFVAYVPNGAVEFTPSREDLKYSEHTKKTLRDIVHNFVKESVNKAKSEIAKAKSHSEALALWTKWSEVVGSVPLGPLVHNGDVFDGRLKFRGFVYRPDNYPATRQVNSIDIHGRDKTVFITDAPVSLQMSSSTRQKVREWSKHKGINSSRFAMTTEKTIDSPWIEASRVVSWERVKAEAPKRPRAQTVKSTAPGRLAGTFDLVGPNGKKTEQDVPTTGNVYWIPTQTYNYIEDSQHTSVYGLYSKFGVSGSVIIVPANRLAKFLRNYPNSIEFMPHLETMIVWDGESLLSDEAKVWMSEDWRREEYLKLNEKGWDDPAISKRIADLRKGQHETGEYQRNFELAQALRMSSKFKRFEKEELDYVFEKYPLFKWSQVEHSRIYCNAVWAARKAGNNV